MNQQLWQIIPNIISGYHKILNILPRQQEATGFAVGLHKSH